MMFAPDEGMLVRIGATLRRRALGGGGGLSAKHGRPVADHCSSAPPGPTPRVSCEVLARGPRLEAVCRSGSPSVGPRGREPRFGPPAAAEASFRPTPSLLLLAFWLHIAFHGTGSVAGGGQPGFFAGTLWGWPSECCHRVRAHRSFQSDQ